MPTIILDRDGVINHDSAQYIRTPDEWRPIEGSLEAIARLCRAEYTVVVATNQSGIGRGFLNVDTLNRIHERMLATLRRKGGNIHAIAFCPHHPDDGCQCRKPAPGLLHTLSKRLKTSLVDVPMVGDSLRDLQAARSAGAKPVLVLSGKNEFQLGIGDKIPLAEFEDTPVFLTLADYVQDLLSRQTLAKPLPNPHHT